MARSGTALAFAVLLAVLEIGSGLQCYQCNSQSEPTCKDPFTASKSAITDCTSPESLGYARGYLSNILPREILDTVAGAPRYCHKIVLQSGTTVRTCLDANPNNLNHTCMLLDAAAKASPLDNTRQIKHCSVCEKDRCNGAASIVSSLPVAVAALVASYLLYKQ